MHMDQGRTGKHDRSKVCRRCERLGCSNTRAGIQAQMNSDDRQSAPGQAAAGAQLMSPSPGDTVSFPLSHFPLLPTTSTYHPPGKFPPVIRLGVCPPAHSDPAGARRPRAGPMRPVAPLHATPRCRLAQPPCGHGAHQGLHAPAYFWRAPRCRPSPRRRVGAGAEEAWRHSKEAYGRGRP